MQDTRDRARGWAHAEDPPLKIVATRSTRPDGLGWVEVDLPFVAETERGVVLRLPSGETVEVGRPWIERGIFVADSAFTIDQVFTSDCTHYHVTIST